MKLDVASDSETDIKWDRPDVDGIVQYRVVEDNFSEKSVRKDSERLEALFKRGSQSRLDGIFKGAPKTEGQKASLTRKQEDQNEAVYIASRQLP